ncbi:M3 family metallopeptidase [Synechococcus elongatus]|uniref:Oligopeptidase A. Metallo peptidase. MEROPS family M03A n=1 Tax=Synechococcus elongatus (strain ATCC 33912 / PCC 7942 / FACHB-805) TaxID=1140 RepID=Q31MI1_SYNE7|nr:M3 family metallopeptidase [Synechococcus elongatus]ABB57738.1 oligopeptidase A. Metallo peptidase. MEROPS family M03A [Synechococcus elongatus PCC 7942 = FACHB-805]AJD57775.1 peptidase M3 [Synechococcus elongatus UTEX 2973]MBD2586453.1 M3 family metallopeptidase [Synechococcus elongatus FACHB-242]MBD2687527.1 M3 family metallopeptidase [Synechococcus elongatus FACHB-1061]MBD2706764.1 M3 family metallopeptidase [Synechococcus elongatus PCC 7942 = FACHB-805]
MAKNIILSAIVGYTYDKIDLFLTSALRNTSADILLIASSPSAQLRHQLLSSPRVKLVDVNLQGEPAEMVFRRFFIAKEILARIEADEILLSDARDVYFQSDPFGVQGVLFAEEPQLIANCKVNSSWIKKYLGEDEFQAISPNPILCGGNHVLDATKAFSLTLTTPEEIVGLPESLLALAAQAAQAAGETEATPEAGPWRITLDFPSFGPFLKYSQRRDLREQVYRAYIRRATEGDLDNRTLIQQILELRRQKAQLLGFNTYAELSLASKMAPSVEAVEGLLEELRVASWDAAIADLEALKAFAREQGAPEADDLKQWDISFWSERLREAKFAFNAEELRPYFPLPRVLEGLFGLCQRLFGIQIEAADGQAPIWQSDVRYFQVKNEQGEAIAAFYLDPYSRPAEKRGGAWMDDCLGRARFQLGDRSISRNPVAYLICNQTPPVGEQPSLMTFGEVETLFHEFGHGLQHMLTTVDHPGCSGINNVEWDAVELPSQFMENWCYDRATLFGMARHWQTGEPLPEAYYEKLLAARTFMAGSGMLRQINFSLLDLELHHRFDPQGTETVEAVRDRIAAKTSVLAPLPDDAFLCSFGHIFAGGYAAGYYSYKWAEVLSADAFSAFEEVDLSNEAAVQSLGRRFRDTVLAQGGSQHPLTVFVDFRGREPATEPLLRHSGLQAA